MSFEVLFDEKVPMRDGVKLSTDIYLPHKGGRFPVILIRTPYNKALQSEIKHGTRDVEFFVKNGYAIAIQDVRGRGDSDGEWHPFIYEGVDGYDTIKWIGDQDWCNGSIAMMGGSYRGWVQWCTARLNPPNLVTMISTAAAGRWFQELPYYNGLVSLGMLEWLHYVGGRVVQNPDIVDWNKVLWHIPIKSMDEVLGRKNTVWKIWLKHSKLDEYWENILLKEEDFKKINIPVLHITGWYDGDQPGATYFYEGMVKYSPAKDKQYLVSGPWDHAGTRVPKRFLCGVDFGPDAIIDLIKLHLWWFDYWLKGDSNAFKRIQEFFGGGRCLTFVMGLNKWVSRESWPPKEVIESPWYISSGGRANSLRGDGKIHVEKHDGKSFDSYTYDPLNPIISSIDFNFYSSKAIETPLDIRSLESRFDVLVYTSEPLREPLEIAGKPKMVLYASSDCIDTDWICLLSDVYPNGRSILIDYGGLRARFRESFGREVFLEPNKIYKFVFPFFFDTNTVFDAGHRIRLSITSSYFPRFDRNLNSGEPIGDMFNVKVANNMVFHGGEYSSALILPVVKK
ncbi:MAG: CocE/NonD family hydrolase [Candidatus Methanomethylicia archaeon]